MKRDHEAAFLRSLTCAVFAVERQLVFLFCEKATVFLRNVSTVSYVHVFLRRCPSAACLADLLAPIPRLSFSVAFASIGVARIRRFWRAFWTVSFSCRVRFLFVCLFFFSCDWIACGCVYLTYLDVGDGYGGVVPRSLVDVVRASVAIVSCGDLHAARWGVGARSRDGWMDRVEYQTGCLGHVAYARGTIDAAVPSVGSVPIPCVDVGRPHKAFG